MFKQRVRKPAGFDLEERLGRYRDAIETAPSHYAGIWAHACHPIIPSSPGSRFHEVRIDLGCGKGAFLVESASREPDVLFIGVDNEPMCIAYSAQKVVERGLDNAVLVPAEGLALPDFLGPGEVSVIYLNFPTPFPRKKEAHGRLTYLDKLLAYRSVLEAGGQVRFRTDSGPFMRFSLTQFDIASYHVDQYTEDARSLWPDDPMTEYEERLVAQGATVYGLTATPMEPNPCQAGMEPTQDAPLGLVDYLPESLDGGYVAHGMEQTVEQLRNYRANRGL